MNFSLPVNLRRKKVYILKGLEMDKNVTSSKTGSDVINFYAQPLNLSRSGDSENTYCYSSTFNTGFSIPEVTSESP